MDTEDDFKPVRYQSRWFCYFDLLGFTAQVHGSNISEVIPAYKKALSDLSKGRQAIGSKGVICAWFSDTFIVYSSGASPKNFARVEAVGRQFFQRLILRGVPVRGALTFGQLYSQSRQNIFVGPALIDAYQYAENQDWLGFVLTPNALDRMAKEGLPPDARAHYRLVTDSGVLGANLSGPVYAFAFNNSKVGGANPYEGSLQSMRQGAPAHAKAKYDRTLAFLWQHSVPPS